MEESQMCLSLQPLLQNRSEATEHELTLAAANHEQTSEVREKLVLFAPFVTHPPPFEDQVPLTNNK